MAELYETLTAGNKFRLQFNCKDEALAFRSKLATHKFRVERPLKDMGVIEHQTLSMDYDLEHNVATFYLRDPEEKSAKTFEILEILPNSTTNSDQ